MLRRAELTSNWPEAKLKLVLRFGLKDQMPELLALNDAAPENQAPERAESEKAGVGVALGVALGFRVGFVVEAGFGEGEALGVGEGFGVAEGLGVGLAFTFGVAVGFGMGIGVAEPLGWGVLRGLGVGPRVMGKLGSGRFGSTSILGPLPTPLDASKGGVIVVKLVPS